MDPKTPNSGFWPKTPKLGVSLPYQRQINLPMVKKRMDRGALAVGFRQISGFWPPKTGFLDPPQKPWNFTKFHEIWVLDPKTIYRVMKCFLTFRAKFFFENFIFFKKNIFFYFFLKIKKIIFFCAKYFFLKNIFKTFFQKSFFYFALAPDRILEWGN